MRLRGKRALVTGGSNGIGKAITEAFLREGASVLFTYRFDVEAAEQIISVVTSASHNVHAMSVDFATPDAVELVMREVKSKFGVVDILVNNVANITRDRYLDIQPEDYARVLRVNLEVPFFLTQAIAKDMIDNGISGSLIHVSSLSAIRARSAMAHYQCSKAALNALSDGVAYELGQYGIRSNVISPGLTATKANRDQWDGDTSIWQIRSQGIPLNRTGVPQDFAGAAVFLASDESAWVSGANLAIDGGAMVV